MTTLTTAHPAVVTWAAAAAAVCGLAVLLALTWLLRGVRAAVRRCAWTGLAVTGGGLAAGSIVAAASGAVVAGSACWALWRVRRSRGPGRSRTGGGS